jgi:4-hydroxy-4-methyl-2-oxoglutarate aldolase
MDHLKKLSCRLRDCYSGAVYDVLRTMGYPDQVLPHTIVSLEKCQKLAGEIYTIEGEKETSLSAHETLIKWCSMLSDVCSDRVLICQPNDDTMAHMGELSAETLCLKGVKGYIVDGGCRDTAFIKKIGFPVFCKYHTPKDIVGKWIPTRLGGSVQIGGVTVRTGDYVIADSDGIVIIPEAIAEEAVNRTEEVLQTENLVRKAILQGADPLEAYLKFGKF